MAKISVMPHVIENALNHVSGHRVGVAGVYNRARYAAETHDALIRWANHVAELVRETASETRDEKKFGSEAAAADVK